MAPGSNPAPDRRFSARQLSRTWLTTSMQERTISLEGLNLTVAVKYASYEMTKRRPPAGKSNRLFGSKIQDVCRCGALLWARVGSSELVP